MAKEGAGRAQMLRTTAVLLLSSPAAEAMQQQRAATADVEVTTAVSASLR